MDAWYKVVTPRREVREGRSFSPDEFAIALEQVVAGTAPQDYSDPAQFFSRTCFTRALTEHSGMVLRRLSGRTENTAPVLTLITQFGGGKTHTLASLYHLANAGGEARNLPEFPSFYAMPVLPMPPQSESGFSLATHGTLWRAGKRPGSIWPGSWRATTEWPRLEAPPKRHPLGPSRWRGYLPRRTRLCCFCLTKHLISSTGIAKWPIPSTLFYKISP